MAVQEPNSNQRAHVLLPAAHDSVMNRNNLQQLLTVYGWSDFNCQHLL